ncbi:uncharacterized protein LOC122630924 isoform X2 [Vespula pensylvanica]|uniref:uncharacterized protein LOC122630924 isoform X2 n=1 Tax=Vespula pensylvanica TaxID=30213 RepID=UPI001CBA31F5|nr:uncharacterized protein LOC122630924 isoform X2 [Vespula pensylvanica]
MSKMLRLELLGVVLLACTQILTEHRDSRETRAPYINYPRYHQESVEPVTKDVKVKHGRLRGTIVKPRTNHDLQLVDVFLGVPYAEPPVGSLRFTPPRSPQPWRGVRQSLEFAPVCPQVLPNLRDEVKPARYEYLERHLQYLKNQSEDCLYLNIYAPHQPEGQRNLKKYPVMVFIHGESYEWNSGNPYDGTVLTAYGNVVFVTINFRLGILGFLRPGTRDDAASNFGLLDQIAALLWLRENIAAFGGDPNSVTLVGHGTGAIFANLLLISPVANNKGLFKRAILMSGSALSADAIGKAPLQITKQVAHALNCPTTTDSDLALCLRFQDVEALLNVKIHKPKYVPAFAPLVDRAVIPDKPINLMENTQLFGRFDLMYGVTESEKFHILPPIALLHGLLDNQRDEILRDHAKATHELEPELVLSKILEHYGDFYGEFTDDYATKNRDMVLEALSDSGTVAPLIMTANLHSRANPNSYMYVFSHPKAMQDYSGQQRQQTIHGEELSYVLGVPLDGSKYDLRIRYNIGETLFSEAMMNWWCSFAYIGNPNAAKRYPYLTDGLKEWGQYELDWLEYNPRNQTYFNLTIPPKLGSHYRSAEMQFWNEDLPNMLRHPNKDIPMFSRPKGPRPTILDFADGIGKYANGSSDKNYDVRNAWFTTKTPSSITESNLEEKQLIPFFITTNQPNLESTTSESSSLKSSSVITMMIGFGMVFLLINLSAFLYLYRKRQATKKNEKPLKRRLSQKDETSKRPKTEKQENHYGDLGYKSDSKPDLNEVIKSDKAYDNNSNFGRRSKLSRENSSSTIDTHIKVREWIQQEIVHRCSPRFLRKTRETLAKEHQAKLTKQEEEEKWRLEEEALKGKKEEPIYDESPTIVVRPGKKSKVPKVSVAIDATPATRTESVLNQVPIELSRKEETFVEKIEQSFDYPLSDSSQFQMTPQVVVIEHHHSRSDPLPMENVLRSMKPNFSTPRIYESDSGSTSSLYAKINPKSKVRLPRGNLERSDETVEIEASKNAEDRTTPLEEIYVKSTKLTTFSGGSTPSDVNVTCREPTVERECISPEEALRTIKRRNYPKVLPDIEKRRSLPVPTTLFLPKQHGNSLRGYKGTLPSPVSGQPPLPPPRMFGTSKSLEFAEEKENHCEEEAVTSDLHIGPLTKRQDSSARNNSDPSIIDSIEGNMINSVHSAGGSVDTIYTNPRCPVHGGSYTFSPNSQILDKDIGDPRRDLIEAGMGNPNWYKPVSKEGKVVPVMSLASSEPRIVIAPREPERQQRLLGGNANWDRTGEPKIVITPRVVNLLGQGNQDLCQTIANVGDACSVETVIPPSKAHTIDLGSSERLELESNCSSNLTTSKEERKEPRIIITAGDSKNTAMTNPKQPKIIIKPTTSFQKSRDQRNVPKISAIPLVERQNSQNVERDKILERKENRPTVDRPPLREKPKITRIPSFSRRKEDLPTGIDKSLTQTHTEKTEIVQRVEAVPGKIANVTYAHDGKSSIPTLQKKDSEKSSITGEDSNGIPTGTVKRKPSYKK